MGRLRFLLVAAFVATALTTTPAQANRITRSVQQVTQGVGNGCRNLNKGELCSVADGRSANQSHMRAYERGWVHKALTLQRGLGDNVGLADQTLPHTHNSFNSSVYAPPTVTNQDPNQIYSMYDQLRMDIRAIEMDVHWFPSLNGKVRNGMKALTLCHGQVQQGVHVGCSIDRPFTNGLAEFRNWLETPGNENEFVLLYLQNELDGNNTAHELAGKAIEKYLGEFIERPPAGKPCADLPTKITPAQVRSHGHRVLVVGNCGPGSWGTWVHSRGNEANWDESGSGAGNDYPGMRDCATPHARGTAGQISRWYEDSTWLSTMVDGKTGQLTPAEATAMARCGVNLIGFDQLTPEDPRLAAVVWSWARNEPANTSPACAASGPDTKFHAHDCTDRRAVACSNGTAWRIAAPARFVDGAAICARTYPGFRFATPHNGFENARLRTAAGRLDVWVNYADTTGRGDWRA